MRRSIGFTNTEVLMFSGDTCSDQHIHVKSNGWDDDTAALQLLTHLEGDVLSVALLVPETQRATRSGLVGALNYHYRSPGRMADCRRKFERAVRRDGEDPSIFTTELETLAIRAFGDMGQSARICMVRDRFVTGHLDCDLRRHFDSVPRIRRFGRLWTDVGCKRATRMRMIAMMRSFTGNRSTFTGWSNGLSQLPW